jgi:hypothetical protein
MAHGPESETFTFNYEEFIQGLGRTSNLITRMLIPKALFKAWGKILAWAIKEEPRVPHKQGRLWASQTIEGCIIIGDEISMDGGFNTEYAARLHEAPDGWNWTLEGSGPKYLETKLARHKDDVMKIIADYILDNGGR